MPQPVKIIVQLVDEASAKMKGVIGSWTELKSALDLAQKAAGYVKEAWDATIGTTIEWADKVRDLVRVIGATPQEAGSLLAVSEQLGVTSEDLAIGLRGAIQKGFSPTIEGLKEMSAQYLAIQDPIARSKFLLDTFGRAGLQMGILMEQGAAGLTKLNDAVDKNLLLTPQQVADAKALDESMITLKENIRGIEVELGTRAIPMMNAFFLASQETGSKNPFVLWQQFIKDWVRDYDNGSQQAIADIAGVKDEILGIPTLKNVQIVTYHADKQGWAPTGPGNNPDPTHPAKYEVRHYKDADGRTVHVWSDGSYSYTKALGGEVGAGGSYIVGEHGAERFTPGQAGTISPNNDQLTQEIRRMLRTLPVILRDAVEKAK